MNKYQATLTEVKSLVIEVNAKDAVEAAMIAKSTAISHKLFEPRIGAVLVADLQEVDDSVQ